jgi:hypothetical protein
MTFVWGLRGELTKLRSLRSTYVTLIVMITATAGLGALISLAVAANWHSISRAGGRCSIRPRAAWKACCSVN